MTYLNDEDFEKKTHYTIYREMPEGWCRDNRFCGHPRYGYLYIWDKRSPLVGGKVGVYKMNACEIAAMEAEKKSKIKEVEDRRKATFAEFRKKIDEENNKKAPAAAPAVLSKSFNNLARFKTIETLLKDIQFDLTVCEIEGWDKKEYLKKLKKIINSIGVSSNKSYSKQLTLY